MYTGMKALQKNDYKECACMQIHTVKHSVLTDVLGLSMLKSKH